MAEGLSATEVGKEIGEHAAHAHSDGDRRDYLISIAEALLLSIVAIVAAWSGYSAAKWSTESSLELAKASATRTKANGAFLQSFTVRAQDASNFNAWFAAYLAHDRAGQRVAEHRFRPGYDVAFRAWLETHPFTNPSAPKGPQYMPQYHPPGLARSVALNAKADHLYAAGEKAGTTGDKYVRVTVILASVLFIVGISGHFRLRAARIGLVCVGTALLVLAAIQILQLPRPPA
jgi:hypothetical protein